MPLIQRIIELFPESVLQTNGDGDTPLHSVCCLPSRPPPSFEMVELLTSGETGCKALRMQSKDGCLPLHQEAGWLARTDIVQRMI